MRLSGDELPLCPVTLGGRTAIWSGELTVGEKLGSFSNEYGFSGDADDGYGALSDVDFDFGSTTDVEISRISVHSGVLAETLSLFAPDLPAADDSALRLHVCSDTFELADANTVNDLRVWAGTRPRLVGGSDGVARPVGVVRRHAERPGAGRHGGEGIRAREVRLRGFGAGRDGADHRDADGQPGQCPRRLPGRRRRGARGRGRR